MIAAFREGRPADHRRNASGILEASAWWIGPVHSSRSGWLIPNREGRSRMSEVKLTLLESRRRISLLLGVATALVVAVSLWDVYRSHRKVIRFQAAWAYNIQHEQCNRLASEHDRIATREEAQAGRSPAGSAEEERHLREARLASSAAVAERGIGAHAGAMAKELRRLARTSH
jgi:hypothetical protein